MPGPSTPPSLGRGQRVGRCRPSALAAAPLLLLWALASGPVEAGGQSPLQPAGAQPTTMHEINDLAYPNALCNDHSRAQYYVRKTSKPAYRKKWLIVFQGGGSCFSNATCLERWNDLDGTSDPIGSHDNMVGGGGAAGLSDFDDNGILDEDGQSLATRSANPFRHFNKIHVHYCSSDAWKGRGGTQWMSGPDAWGRPLQMSIVFHGASIAEAVIDIVKQGTVDSDGVLPGNPLEQPDDVSSEVVLYGQSAGAAGLASQLDQFAAYLKSPPVLDGGPTVWGIIDSNDAVGLDLGVKDATALTPLVYWSGGTGDNVISENIVVDGSCGDDYPAYPDRKLCNNTGRLLLQYISTPVFVAENAFDGVIHGAYEDAGMSSEQIRAGITAGAALFPDGVGLFRPNFSKREHVQGMNNATFLATDNGSHPAPPRMVRPGKTSRVSLASALACFRDRQNGLTTDTCRFVNKTAR